MNFQGSGTIRMRSKSRSRQNQLANISVSYIAAWYRSIQSTTCLY